MKPGGRAAVSRAFSVQLVLKAAFIQSDASVCLRVVLPAVRPAPAGAAAAGSPAAAAPPPAAYGYTPNRGAGGDVRRSQSESGEEAKSEPRQPVTSAEQETEERRYKRRKVDSLRRCESSDLEIKREAGGSSLVEQEKKNL